MLGPIDEFPVHQIPQPIAWPGSSDRNFYDRSYFNAHDRTGDIFLISGIGYYPNLGVKDAFMLVRRGDTQTAVHLSDAIDPDRLNQHVLGYRIEVSEPLHKLRIILDETEGIAADLTWNGLFDVVQEQRHVLRAGTRVTLDAQRFAQLGSWSGPSRSTARRSPSTRRSGSAAATGRGASGRSARPSPRAGRRTRRSRACGGCTCRWRSTTSPSCLIIQEDPSGFRSRSTTAPGSGRTAASSSWAGRGSRSTTAPAPASRPARPSRPPRPTARPSTSTWSPNCRCRSTSAAATAATRTGSTACGRARSSPSA